jgi:hypothetical protein
MVTNQIPQTKKLRNIITDNWIRMAIFMAKELFLVYGKKARN